VVKSCAHTRMAQIPRNLHGTTFADRICRYWPSGRMLFPTHQGGNCRSEHGVFWTAEVCDPVEDDKYGYEIGGILVADFVTPNWFGHPHAKGPIGERVSDGDPHVGLRDTQRNARRVSARSRRVREARPKRAPATSPAAVHPPGG